MKDPESALQWQEQLGVFRNGGLCSSTLEAAESPCLGYPASGCLRGRSEHVPPPKVALREKRRTSPWLTLCLSVAVQALLVCSAPGQSLTDLRWGGDAEGGAPFVAADPANPAHVVGFDVDIAALLAAELQRQPRFVQTAFSSLEAGALRGDFDIALGGVEDSPSRRARLAATVPYYRFREILTVRADDLHRYAGLSDFSGKRVGTLAATQAHALLAAEATRTGLIPVVYEDDVHPYDDLVSGRLDAVLLDEILATRATRREPALANLPQVVATGHYIGLLAPQNRPLRDRVNVALRTLMTDGRLERVLRRWNVWNEEQRQLYAEVAAAAADTRPPERQHPPSVLAYAPSIARATGVTLLLSTASMAIAIALGALIAVGRLYGATALRYTLATWVELLRGTPLLLQLFVLYYGFSGIVRLPAAWAGTLALGLNYGAYESEIYRSALTAVPSGQMEAARALGLTDAQALRYVRMPLAIRHALAPTTNDFVALLKDSSLVSAVTVVELTKQTSIMAADLGSWLVPGAICAGLYLLLSLPLGHLARQLERWYGTT